MENFRQLVEVIGTAVDGVGVFVVAGGALVATAGLLVRRATTPATTIRLVGRTLAAQF